MGIPKTAVGIFAGSVAVDAFKAAGHTNDLSENLILKGVGSVAAAVSFHALKDEVIEVAEEIHQIGNRKLKAIAMKD